MSGLLQILAENVFLAGASVGSEGMRRFDFFKSD
jgi:hypothetical protein